MAQFEAEVIRERTIAGLAAARRRGVRLGRKPVTLDVDRARELRSEGRSFRQVAAELGVSVGLVHKVLARDVHESPSAAPSGEA
jgi:DNA invertase Pin-like site-specific DNA recombinase